MNENEIQAVETAEAEETKELNQNEYVIEMDIHLTKVARSPIGLMADVSDQIKEHIPDLVKLDLAHTYDNVTVENVQVFRTHIIEEVAADGGTEASESKGN